MHAMRIQTRPRALALTLPLLMALALLLSACGDGGGVENGGGDNNNSGGIPTSSADEFSKWAASRSADDTSEPLDVESLSPPTSDTTEPLVL